MSAITIIDTTNEITDALSRFGTTRNELYQIALQATSARYDATPLHPINAPGTFSYMEGVASLRRLFLLKEGWKSTRPNNIEAVENQDLGITLVFQNVDQSCSTHDPQPISGKGEGARKLVNNPTGYLWKYMEEEDKAAENQQVWFLCVSCNSEIISVELSRPKSIIRNKFGLFLERIFVATNNDWILSEDSFDEPVHEGQDLDISVTRK